MKISLIAALVACMTAPVLSLSANAATATGYTRAEDVEYEKVGNYVVNWGVRDETCTFLSTYAEAFYTGSYEYSVLSENEGGTSAATAPNSALYSALQSMMRAKHTKITNYQETRFMYCYTDCQRNDYSTITCFYSEKTLSGTWDSAKTWNREHTWPNRKGLGGSDENDIMMLRPTSVSANSSRGNEAYGESSGYYDPGENVRGDCARIVLYVYTRWGNTKFMWGSKGVMESLDVLLDWMAEDPVDTWEMGRNDAVQSITGTRNVFVDYPEYAWLLFGKEIPETVTTPSKSKEACEHEFGEWRVTSEPTETTDGERWRFCKKCDAYEKEILPQTGAGDSAANVTTTVSCNSSIVSPFAVTVLLAGAYVFSRKK